MEIADETLQPFAKGDFLFARRTFTGRFEAGIRELGKISTTNDELVYWTGSAIPAMAFRCMLPVSLVLALAACILPLLYCAVVHSRLSRLRRSVKRLKKAVCGGKESDGRIHNNEILLPKPTGYTPFSCPSEFSKEIDQFPILKT